MFNIQMKNALFCGFQVFAPEEERKEKTSKGPTKKKIKPINTECYNLIETHLKILMINLFPNYSA